MITATQTVQQVNITATQSGVSIQLQPVLNVGGDGGVTDHTALTSIGTKTHSTLDTEVGLNNAKISYPSADSTKVGFISVTQAVDLDTMESNIATNNAKVSLTDGSVTEAKLSTQYKSTSVISALNVDWSSSFVYTKTLGTNTTFTFSNLYVGVKTLILTGNFTVAFPTGFTLTNGSEAYDGTKECLVEIICYDTSTPKGLINITYSV